MSDLSDKELKILDQIARNSAISQRELSKETGISLGLINIILKRFIKTGYLQVSRLNKRKLEYLLTPPGFLAVARRTYQYASRTIRNYQHLHSQLTALLWELHQSGYEYFSIYGDGELKEMIESLVSSIFDNTAVTLTKDHRNDPRAAILNVTAGPVGNDCQGNIVGVLERIGL